MAGIIVFKQKLSTNNILSRKLLTSSKLSFKINKSNKSLKNTLEKTASILK
jgi:hypothetical protein